MQQASERRRGEFIVTPKNPSISVVNNRITLNPGGSSIPMPTAPNPTLDLSNNVLTITPGGSSVTLPIQPPYVPPKLPFFLIVGNTHNTVISQNTPVRFNQVVKDNIGGCWDSQNYYYIVPETGTYALDCSIYINTVYNSPNLRFELQENTYSFEPRLLFLPPASSNETIFNTSMTMVLRKGWKVKIVPNGQVMVFMGGEYHSRFSFKCIDFDDP